MRMAEVLNPIGTLTLRRRDATGAVVEERRAHNSIVLSGRDLVAKLFIGEPIAAVSHVAVGTGSAAVDPSADSQLGSELFRKPINAIVPAQHLATTEDDRRKVTITADLDFAEGNGALTEAGLFNAELGGPADVMYNRVTFPPINKTSDFKLTLIWEIIF